MSKDNNEIQVIQPEVDGLIITHNNIEELEKAHVIDVNLVSEYWSPSEGEDIQRRAFFDRIETCRIKDKYSDDKDATIDKEHAFFFYKRDGKIVGFRNASAILVSTMKRYLHGQPFLITYLGVKKSGNKNFDNWEINLLEKPKK